VATIVAMLPSTENDEKKCQKSGRLEGKAAVLETKSGRLEAVTIIALQPPFLQCCLQQKMMKKKRKKSGRLEGKADVLETKSGRLKGIKQSPL
jgi:hypothetical protein